MIKHAALTVALLLPLPALAGPECKKLPDTAPCPQIYRVFEGSGEGPSLDLLVLSDGFPEGSLDQFHCAVDRTIDALLAIPPFETYRCHINVYRMDLVTRGRRSGISTHTSCSTTCDSEPAKRFVDWECEDPSLGDPMLPDDTVACAVQELDTQLCSNYQNCWMLYPGLDGELAISRYANCLDGVDFEAVLVLANASDYAGAAKTSTSPPISVATLWSIDDSQVGRLAAHEVAHSLFGLHDEYVGTGNGHCPYVPGRNVVRGSELQQESACVWESRCEESCETVCRYGGDCPADTECPNTEPCCGAPRAAVPDGFLGFVEGACYNNCGYYRAQKSCMMLKVKKPFCVGCEVSTSRLMAERCIEPCEKP